MIKQKPSIPKGTRDFGPAEMSRRNFILNTIREVYRKYGYQPLETPSMENLSVLTGKYGDEGDQLLFKILNNGLDDPKNMEKARTAFENVLQGKNDADLTERALRYDLTVPFARYVVMNQSEITFPFRRYQIQPVWRADRPQKGRYREFYQCDADVVGTDSLICEAEIVLMLEEVFEKLGIREVSIKMNNRKILSGIVEVIGTQGKESELLVAIDKLDKIGQEKVIEELKERGFSEKAVSGLLPIFSQQGDNRSRLEAARSFVKDSETGLQGIREVEEVLQRVEQMGSPASTLQFDITLARGLSYYTGAIFEVKPLNSVISSSISGGGRYDNLTGVFGMPGMSGVGISFGVDRIYDVMEDLQLFPEQQEESTRVLLISFDDETQKHALSLLAAIRRAGLSAEIYPDQVKLKKQFAYADKKNIPFTLVVGSEEMKSGRYGLKELKSGEQQSLGLDEIIARLKQ
ncbi:MAG: histidine--tRNA ligase [Cyclobacteriaceae bacterium]